MLLFRCCLLLCLLLCPLSAFASAAFTEKHLVNRKGTLTLSYVLKDSENAFFEALTDHIRAGNLVRIKHRIIVDKVGSLWGHVADKTVVYYAVYNLFDDSFKAGTSPDDLKTMRNKKELRNYLLRIEDVALADHKQLETGSEYTVNVETRIETQDDDGWLRYLPLRTYFREELNAEFYYIAR